MNGGTGERQGRSPWFWVGMGCLGLFIIGGLGVGALILAGMRLFHTVANEKIPPVTAQSVKQELHGVPVYPGAQLDVPGTEILMKTATMVRRLAGARAGPMAGWAVASYHVSEPPAKVLEWYDKHTPGWLPTNYASPLAQRLTEGQQRHYRKGHDMLIVQATTHPTGTVLTLQLMPHGFQPGPSAAPSAAARAKQPGP